ncbi:unnamed protein product [Durusdinium trenchii]|uniref:Uncharacterized protein n=2 Tax=Durusdinium trenchii TaxID=1381693 RepID=A0ABP0NWV3_9DINO
MFRQRLVKVSAEARGAYDAETGRIVQKLVAQTMQTFIRRSEAAAMQRMNHCSQQVNVDEPCRRHGGEALVVKEFQAKMAELGFPDGVGDSYDGGYGFLCLDLTASWEDSSCEDAIHLQPTLPKGSCVTCPICQDHRPAVALVPCGHVVCRDCRCQIRQCPFCREPVHSSTRCLFLD